MYMYYSRYTNNLQESAVIKANTFHRQQSTVNVGLMSSKIFLKIVQLDTLMCICLSDVGINSFYIK